MDHALRRSFVARAVVLFVFVFLFSAVALAQQTDDGRIVGGQEATPGEWPWQVALVRKNQSDMYQGQFCGGSIIARTWVLTAAHCVEDSTISDLDVVAGIHDLKVPDPNYRRVALAEIIVHPGWNTDTNDNDIALLRLKTPIDERAASGSTLPIKFAKLPPGSIGSLAGVTTTVTGWGNRTPGGNNFPARLHEVEVGVITNAECNSDYGGGITENMLCAGVPGGGKDSCQGDSGGPLVYKNGSQWQQVGVVSFGIGCARPEYPGVYARVSRYLGWIASYTNPVVATKFAYLPMIVNVPYVPPPSPLVNGNFEQGPGKGWMESSSQGYDLIVDNFNNNNLDPRGNWAAWLGGVLGEVSILSQQVTVPAGSPVLSYYYAIGSEEDDCGYDFAYVLVNGSAVKQYNLCKSNFTNGWVRGTVNLSAYAGKSVTLGFRAETDGLNNSNFFLDDVAFGASLSADEPADSLGEFPGAEMKSR